MRVNRIFHPASFKQEELIWLSDDASHHLAVVLRAKPGDTIILFDGQNHQADAQIEQIQKKRVQVKITHHQLLSVESPLQLHLALGIAKGDRMTFSIQKAVELGIREITPIWTQHTALKWDKQQHEKKLSLWQKIIISACEQSGRNYLPELHPIIRFEEFLEQHTVSNGLILEPRSGQKLSALKWIDDNNATLLIGPEGGFHPQEISHALENNYQALTLGPRILRTETAVLTAITVIQAFKGDL